MAIDRQRGMAGYLPLREAIDQLFQGSFIAPQSVGRQGGYPPVDLYVTDQDVVIEMAIPGAKAEDINISVTGDAVSLTGDIKRGYPERSQLYVDEIWEGKFQRSFALPIQVDANAADASFDDGILILKLPKSEASRPRKIQVKTQQAGERSKSVGNSETLDAEKVGTNGK